MTYAKKARALVAALALLIALPTTVLGVSSTATETLTVQSQITMTGVPASLDYASTLGGQQVNVGITAIAVSTNSPAGFAFDVEASALTATSSTIASTTRSFYANWNDQPTPGVTFASGVNTMPGAAYPGARARLAESSGAASAVLDVISYINVPANAVPGAYTGTVTFHAETR